MNRECVAGRADEPASVSGDAVIRAPAGGSEIVIRTTSRLAGAIHSLTWNGWEFIDSFDHGRQLQSAANFDLGGTLRDEAFNPTEAGCERDGDGPTSTSRLISFSASGAGLQTVTRMAFWLPPGRRAGGRIAANTTAVSDHLLRKDMQIGVPGFPHAIRYAVTFTVPPGERHTRGTFEALTGYMPPAFRTFHALGDDGSLEPLSAGPGEQRHPVIISTATGSHAMGAWSPSVARTTGQSPTYGRAWFEHAHVSKWNCVFRERARRWIWPRRLAAGDYRYLVFVAVGTRDQVHATLTGLRST